MASDEYDLDMSLSELIHLHGGAWVQEQMNLVAPLVQANQGMLVQFINDARAAGYSIDFVVIEITKRIRFITYKQEILGALLFNGGYTVTQIAQFYIQRGVTDPKQLLYAIQSSGFPPDLINAALTNLGSPYSQYARSAFRDLSPQNVIGFANDLINRAEKIPLVGGALAYLAREELAPIQNAIKVLNPTKW